MKKDILYSKCREKWGFHSQVDRCIEEMAELTKALCKAKRHKRPEKWLANVYEEIADVRIMLEQMTNIFDGDVVVPMVIERKLARLEKELEKCTKEA